ncbi:MAG: phage tail assembly protein [Thermodesulfobacteriota bacterium]
METLKLDHPVTVDGVEVTELRVRRPKVRDRLAVEKGGGSDAEKEHRLLANLAEVTPKTLEELDLADYLRLQEVLQGFLSPRLPS